ncbi:hypothetical protein OKW96_09150 [Sphingobacterium sp. KU25419]|nr:hypothetical protein OKW96_09150 [Sphingobacterium sp. KU25419]
MNKQSSVAIKVMDALGNEVVQLMNGSLDAGNQNLSLIQVENLILGFILSEWFLVQKLL